MLFPELRSERGLMKYQVWHEGSHPQEIASTDMLR